MSSLKLTRLTEVSVSLAVVQHKVCISALCMQCRVHGQQLQAATGVALFGSLHCSCRYCWHGMADGRAQARTWIKP